MKQEVTSSSPTALLYGVGPLSQEHRRDDKVAQETTARPPGSAKADHKVYIYVLDVSNFQQKIELTHWGDFRLETGSARITPHL